MIWVWISTLVNFEPTLLKRSSSGIEIHNVAIFHALGVKLDVYIASLGSKISTCSGSAVLHRLRSINPLKLSYAWSRPFSRIGFRQLVPGSNILLLSYIPSDKSLIHAALSPSYMIPILSYFYTDTPPLRPWPRPNFSSILAFKDSGLRESTCLRATVASLFKPVKGVEVVSRRLGGSGWPTVVIWSKEEVTATGGSSLREFEVTPFPNTFMNNVRIQYRGIHHSVGTLSSLVGLNCSNFAPVTFQAPVSICIWLISDCLLG
jgi:hypothetical protein